MENIKIYEAIAGAMGEIKAVGKNQKNEKQGYSYRGIDDIANEMHSILSKHKIFITPDILEHIREERETLKGTNLIYSIIKVKYTFWTVDGSSVSCTVIGEGMDSGDKATNKALATAYKYALTQIFCIPTAEAKDSETDSPEIKVKTNLNGGATEKQIKYIYTLINNDLNKESKIKEFYKINSMNELTKTVAEEIIQKLSDKRVA